jgi:hypothetical protein
MRVSLYKDPNYKICFLSGVLPIFFGAFWLIIFIPESAKVLTLSKKQKKYS